MGVQYTTLMNLLGLIESPSSMIGPNRLEGAKKEKHEQILRSMGTIMVLNPPSLSFLVSHPANIVLVVLLVDR